MTRCALRVWQPHAAQVCKVGLYGGRSPPSTCSSSGGDAIRLGVVARRSIRSRWRICALASRRPGPERDAYLDGGPWFYAHTEQSTLFRVVNHVRDVGHFLVLGATGSGKSTLGNVLRAQWLQYPRTQAIVFDLDGHARLLTYLLGGTWHDLGSRTLRFQPLRHVDDLVRRGIILQWLLDGL
jgi:hypothetical protein